MKVWSLVGMACLVFSAAAAAAETPTITNLSAKQRYPWNGLVDITCDIAYSDSNVVWVVSFVATNTATGAALPVQTLRGAADGEGMDVTAGHRAFIWDAGTDVPDVKIDDVALTADVKRFDGVQLWRNGPYWERCNVGASRPEDTGFYFWWGDTVGYKRNASDTGWVSVADGSSFSFSSGNCPTYKKRLFAEFSG